MKISFLAPAHSIHSVRWIEFFAKRGHQIQWFSLTDPIVDVQSWQADVSFVKLDNLPEGIGKPLRLPLSIVRALPLLRSKIREERPDLLHIHSAGTYGLLGLLSGAKKAVLTPWGSDILLSRGVREYFSRIIVRHAQFYTCDGQNTRERLITLGADQTKVHLIRFGSDTDLFHPVDSPTPKPRLIVASLRSFEPVYDIDTLLNTAHIVSKRRSDIEFVFAGDGSERNRLEALASSLGLLSSGVVRFVGRQSAPALAALLQGSDIYVSASLSDSGLSASTAEAMSCGLPVVVSDSGDNRWWLNEDQGGYVVPCGDASIFADRICELADSAELRKRFGFRNRQCILDKNSYASEMLKMEALYSHFIEDL